jgi:hypothetical protein
LDKIELKKCPKCLREFKGILETCPWCGTPLEQITKSSSSNSNSLEFIQIARVHPTAIKKTTRQTTNNKKDTNSISKFKINFIPGFRTGSKWKMIISILYYILCLLMALGGGILISIICILIPLFIFNISKIGKTINTIPVVQTMKQLLSLIPGFRTNRVWKKMIAIIGYSFMIFLSYTFLFSDSIATSPKDKCISIGIGSIVSILLIIIPFILITNFLGVREKLPMLKSNKIWVKVLASILLPILLIISLGISFNFLNNLHTSDYIVRMEQINAEKAKEVAASNFANEQADAKQKANQKLAYEKKKDDELAKQQADAKTKTEQQVADNKKIKTNSSFFAQISNSFNSFISNNKPKQQTANVTKSKSNKSIFAWIVDSYSSFMDNQKAEAEKKANQENQAAATKLKEEIASAKINTNLQATLYPNDDFTLPSTVVAIVGGKNKQLPVTWDKKSLDTSKEGTNVITGTIPDFPKQIKYTVTVLPFTFIDSFRNIETKSSMVAINNVVKGNCVWFKITKDGKTEDQYCDTTNGGVVNYNLYLHLGSGTYNVTVLTGANNPYETVISSYFYELTKFCIVNSDTRDISYLLPSTYVQSNSSEIIQLANNITKDCFSDMEKTKAIHDWVCNSIAYDIAGSKSWNIHEYSALETLHNKLAVCNGYANLTAALNRAIGIKTKICSGTATNSDGSGNHAWNETFIDGKWIIQDTTWDAGRTDFFGNFKFDHSDKYFNPSEKDFSKDHTKTSETYF